MTLVLTREQRWFRIGRVWLVETTTRPAECARVDGTTVGVPELELAVAGGKEET